MCQSEVSDPVKHWQPDRGVCDKFVKLSPFIKMKGSKSLKTPFGVSGTFTGVHF